MSSPAGVATSRSSSSNHAETMTLHDSEDSTSTKSSCGGDAMMEDSAHVASASRGRVVDKVEDMDILCGRGCNRLCHPGNKRFREIVGAQKERYQRATKREDKTRITLEILQRLMCSDEETSRFLLKDPKTNCWVDVGFEYAKEKVSHALRSRPTEDKRKRTKPKKKVMRKPSFSPQLEDLVQGMISDQQTLLQSLIEREVVSPPKAQVST